jgi:hypothetical protein
MRGIHPTCITQALQIQKQTETKRDRETKTETLKTNIISNNPRHHPTPENQNKQADQDIGANAPRNEEYLSRVIVLPAVSQLHLSQPLDLFKLFSRLPS